VTFRDLELVSAVVSTGVAKPGFKNVHKAFARYYNGPALRRDEALPGVSVRPSRRGTERWEYGVGPVCFLHQSREIHNAADSYSWDSIS